LRGFLPEAISTKMTRDCFVGQEPNLAMTKKRDYFASFFATPSNDRTHPLQVIARVFVRSNLNQKQRDCFVPRNDKKITPNTKLVQAT